MPEILVWIVGIIGAAFFGAMLWIIVGGFWQGILQTKKFNRDKRRDASLCVYCGYDLRGSAVKCPECGKLVEDDDEPQAPQSEFDLASLRNDWPAQEIEPRTPSLDEETVAVHMTPNWLEADLLAQQLAARGVWCRVDSKETFVQSGAAAYSVNQLGVVVPVADAEVANEILQRFRRHARSEDAG